MYNCHDDVLAFHNQKVTLPDEERNEMRQRRDANRRRLRDGLARDKEPSPSESQTQGSYAHRTMVQDKSKDYDIDDGAYFWKDALVGPKGGDKTAHDVKEMVRKALHDDRFSTPPEVRTNCVRVFYNAGYHVDVPVYRQVNVSVWGEKQVRCEIASSGWKTANPVAVTRWFNEQNERQSPDTTNGRQLRRQTRLNKAFARSRESWRPRIATGFMITTLIADNCYRSDAAREDAALYQTIVAMRDRLHWSLEIAHPTVAGEMLTSGPDDARSRFLRDKLDWAIGELGVLLKAHCTRQQALKAWDKVFDTTFFSDRLDDEGTDRTNKGARTPAAVLIADTDRPSAIDRGGGGRYA